MRVNTGRPVQGASWTTEQRLLSYPYDSLCCDLFTTRFSSDKRLIIIPHPAGPFSFFISHSLFPKTTKAVFSVLSID